MTLTNDDKLHHNRTVAGSRTFKYHQLDESTQDSAEFIQMRSQIKKQNVHLR